MRIYCNEDITSKIWGLAMKSRGITNNTHETVIDVARLSDSRFVSKPQKILRFLGIYPLVICYSLLLKMTIEIVEFPIEIVDFPIEIVEFPIEIVEFPIEIVEFPIENGDFPLFFVGLPGRLPQVGTNRESLDLSSPLDSAPLSWEIRIPYPLVNLQKTMENHHF